MKLFDVNALIYAHRVDQQQVDEAQRGKAEGTSAQGGEKIPE